MVISTPIGWNPYMDKLLKNNSLNFNKVCFIKRIGKKTWVSVKKEEALKCIYGKPYPFANCIFIGEYKK